MLKPEGAKSQILTNEELAYWLKFLDHLKDVQEVVDSIFVGRDLIS